MLRAYLTHQIFMSFSTPDMMRGAPGNSSQNSNQINPMRGFDTTMQSRMALQTLNLQNNISQQKNILGNFTVPTITASPFSHYSSVQSLTAPTLSSMTYGVPSGFNMGMPSASDATYGSVLMTEAQPQVLSTLADSPDPTSSQSTDNQSTVKVYKNTRDMADQLFKTKEETNSFERMAHETFANHKLGFEHLNRNLKRLSSHNNTMSSGLETQAELMNNMHKETRDLQSEVQTFKQTLKQLKNGSENHEAGLIHHTNAFEKLNSKVTQVHEGLIHHTEAFKKLNSKITDHHEALLHHTQAFENLNTKIDINHYHTTDSFSDLADKLDNLETALAAQATLLDEHQLKINNISKLESAMQTHSNLLQNHENEIRHKPTHAYHYTMVPDVNSFAPNRRPKNNK